MEEITAEMRESKLRILTKIMALANDPGASEGEKESAMKRAESIMLKFKITEAQVEMRRRNQNPNLSFMDLTDKEDADLYYASKQCDWEKQLAWGLAPVFDCKAVGCRRWDQDEMDYVYYMTFVGIAEDVGTVVYFFDYLQNEIGTASEIAYRGVRDRHAFGMGMVARVTERLQELYKRLEQSMPSECTALVVTNKALTEQRFKKEFPKTQTSRGARIANGSAYHAGVRAGDNVHLGSGASQVGETKKIA